MEAMATGLPIIVPNVGDMKEIAQNEITGYLIDDINNADAYAEKIIMLLKDDKLREKYAQNATELIKTYHRTSSAGDNWRNIFTKLGY